MASNIAPIRKAVARPASDAEIGMAWWNSMSPRQRLESLRAADTDCPAVAWALWKESTYCDEEKSHG